MDGQADTPGGFGILDVIVLGLYFLVLVATGVWFSMRKNRNTEDYFLGGRKMPVWAVAVSVLATSLSAATFIGGPQQAYAGNLTYLATNIGMILAALVIGLLFIPAFYRHHVATVYELIGKRCGPAGVVATSGAFLLGRIMASGARIYIVAIPAALIMFGAQPEEAIPDSHLLMAIGALVVVGIVYTLVGGVASVIWTDVVQMLVFMVAIGAAVFVLFSQIPVPTSEIVSTLREARVGEDGPSKLTVFDTRMDWGSSFTLWASIFAFTLWGVAAYGTDQDMVQRMLTCKSAARGSWSVISANIIAVPVVGVFMGVGLLLYIFYDRPDIMGENAPDYEVYDSARIFLSFVLREMPAGLTGLMLAGLFAAGLSSLNSGLNSMSSTVVNDFYRRIAPKKSEKHYLFVGRLGVVFWGLVLGGFAGLCIYWQRSSEEQLIDFALGVMAFAYAGMVAVFLTVICTKRGSSASVIAALIVGIGATLVLQPWFANWALGNFASGLPPAFADPWRTLANDVAFPWRFMIAAALSLIVCMLGRATDNPVSKPEPETDPKPAPQRKPRPRKRRSRKNELRSNRSDNEPTVDLVPPKQD
ncbi:MAG: sodium:solute symporter [Phycisphaerales bacterium]|nr:MAG: sodium:solute symporter [Phycisphaerales bacterium]